MCHKTKLSFCCIHKWACPRITYANKGIAEVRNMKENLLESYLQELSSCIIDLSGRGKFTF